MFRNILLLSSASPFEATFVLGAKKSPSTSCVSRLLDTGECRTNPSVGTNSPFSGELHWENMPRHPTIEDVDQIFQIEVGDIHKNGSPVQIGDFRAFLGPTISQPAQGRNSSNAGVVEKNAKIVDTDCDSNP